MKIKSFARLILMTAVVSTTVSAAQRQQEELTPAEKEMKRRQAVYRWAEKNDVRYKQLVEKLYEPILDGCKKGYEKNQEYARKAEKRAKNAADHGMDEAAERYKKMAELFESYAKQNRKLLKAFDAGNDSEFTEACEAILKIEGKLLDLTGQEYKRNWFLPQELENQQVAGN